MLWPHVELIDFAVGRTISSLDGEKLKSGRVRIGPIRGVAQYDRVVADLSRIGIADTHLVSE